MLFGMPTAQLDRLTLPLLADVAAKTRATKYEAANRWLFASLLFFSGY